MKYTLESRNSVAIPYYIMESPRVIKKEDRGFLIITVDARDGHPSLKERGEEIVSACNHYHELVDSLDLVVAHLRFEAKCSRLGPRTLLILAKVKETLKKTREAIRAFPKEIPKDIVVFKYEMTSTGYSAYADKYPVYTTGKDKEMLIANALDAFNLWRDVYDLEHLDKENILLVEA